MCIPLYMHDKLRQYRENNQKNSIDIIDKAYPQASQPIFDKPAPSNSGWQANFIKYFKNENLLYANALERYKALTGKTYSVENADLFDQWVFSIFNAIINNNEKSLRHLLKNIQHAHPENKSTILIQAYKLAKEAQSKNYSNLVFILDPLLASQDISVTKTVNKKLELQTSLIDQLSKQNFEDQYTSIFCDGLTAFVCYGIGFLPLEHVSSETTLGSIISIMSVASMVLGGYSLFQASSKMMRAAIQTYTAEEKFLKNANCE